MELHSIKEKESKSKLTGGCPLNGQMVMNAESVKKVCGKWKKSFVHGTSLLRN